MYTRFRFKSLEGSKILKDFSTHYKKNKYFLEKELLLKGIIHDEDGRKKEFEQTVADTDAHMVRNGLPIIEDRSYLRNQISSAYYDLFNDSDNTLKSAVSSLCDKSKNRWLKYFTSLLNIKGGLKENETKRELISKFLRPFSLKLNLAEIDEYKNILNEELIEVNEVLGLYKSSWGSLSNLNGRLKRLKQNTKQLKALGLFKENTTIEIDFVIEFHSDSTEIKRQYFLAKIIGSSTDNRIELTSHECLELIQLRNYGDFVKEEIKDYKEIRESGANPSKQNTLVQKTKEGDYAINIGNLDVN